jgi:hypothetical protein
MYCDFTLLVLLLFWVWDIFISRGLRASLSLDAPRDGGSRVACLVFTVLPTVLYSRDHQCYNGLRHVSVSKSSVKCVCLLPSQFLEWRTLFNYKWLYALILLNINRVKSRYSATVCSAQFVAIYRVWSYTERGAISKVAVNRNAAQ